MTPPPVCQAQKCRYDGGVLCGALIGALFAYTWLMNGITRTDKKIDEILRRLDEAPVTTNVEVR